MPAILKHPQTGYLWIVTFAEDFLAWERRLEETTAQAVERLTKDHFQQKVPAVQGWEVHLVKSADIPKDKTRRHAWRLNGTVVVADPTVPDPPHPKQALLDAIEVATDLTSLKAALKGLLT